MRIGIAAEFIGHTLCGPGTYTANLLAGLAQLETDHTFYPYFSNRRAVDTMAWPPHLQPRLVGPYLSWVRVPFSQPLAVLRHGVELLHVQNAVAPWCPVPVVATIHDLSFEFYQETFTPLMAFRLQKLVRSTARQSVLVLTSSENTKRDLVRVYGLPDDKVSVIYPGLGEHFGPQSEARVREVQDRFQTSDRYILFVGALQPKKNVDKLVRAYAALRANDQISHRLVIAGGQRWLASGVFELVQELGLESEVTFTSWVSDEDLPALYAGADLLVDLSAYEGFGFPPLEAMACGTPALVANRASLPEVVGDAGLIVEPDDIDAVAANILRMLTDQDLRNGLIRRGQERASHFSILESARQTVAAYELARTRVASRASTA